MADENQSGIGNNEGEQTAGDTGNTEGQTGDQSQAGDQTGEGTEQGTETGDEGGEEQDAFIKDKDGKEFISREAFEKRVAKLTAQKHEGSDAKSLLEAIRTDPVIREDFIKSLNLEASRTDAPKDEIDEPTSFDKFLAPLPPEYQAHYRGFMQAISPVFEGYMQKLVQDQIGPIRSWIGETKVRDFAKSNPDYARYESQVAEIISTGRAKSLEDAYKIASFEARLKGASNAGAKAEADRRAKLSKAPLTGKDRGSLQTKDRAPNSLRDAIMKAASETGWQG
jgi:hypothetical protein